MGGGRSSWTGARGRKRSREEASVRGRDEARVLVLAEAADLDEAEGGSGMSRTSLDLRSPIDGPPKTRMISLDEPPLSLMGMMYVALGVALTSVLYPDPPDMTTMSDLR